MWLYRRLEGVDRSRVGVVLATAICGTLTLDKKFVKVTGMGRQPHCPLYGGSPHLYDAAMATRQRSPLPRGGEASTKS